MLLESASKGIKSAIMNIAKGVIKPRVEFQSYIWLLSAQEDDELFRFNGDVNVVVKAVENITIKAAQQQLRKELLQTTSNPQDIKIMGYEGRGILLREIFKDVNLPEDVIPDRLELKELEALDKANEQKMIDSQSEKGDKGVEATKVQIDGQKEMHVETMKAKEKDQVIKESKQKDDKDMKIAELTLKDQESARKQASDVEGSKRTASTKIAVETVKAQQKREKEENDVPKAETK